MDIEDVIYWLREGEGWAAADLLSLCEFRYHYVDTGFWLNGSLDIDIVTLDILSPRRILDTLPNELQEQVKSIENAVQELSQAQHCFVRSINWVANIGRQPSPPDSEIEHTLNKLNSEHVRSAWYKASSRKSADPDGAITAAKTMIESVCKHILISSGVQYPGIQNPGSIQR